MVTDRPDVVDDVLRHSLEAELVLRQHVLLVAGRTQRQACAGCKSREYLAGIGSLGMSVAPRKQDEFAVRMNVEEHVDPERVAQVLDVERLGLRERSGANVRFCA